MSPRAKFATRCIADDNPKIDLGLSSINWVINEPIPFKCTTSNVTAYHWDFGDGGTSTDKAPQHPYPKPGMYTVTLTLKLFGNRQVSTSQKIWLSRPFGSNANTTLDISKIRVTDLQAGVSREQGLHFANGSAPVAPKAEGGAYILWQEASTKHLKVTTIDGKGQKISGPDFDLGPGRPVDIVATDWGFVALVIGDNNGKQTDLLKLVARKSDGSPKFEKTIMDNGAEPTQAKPDQIIFYDKNQKPVGGMQAMYDPDNGRLAYGQQRIAVLFAHYNYFGITNLGKRNVHTGDTLITFDENGGDVKLGFSWGTSHSLTQRMIFDGDGFVTVALGDYGPNDIRGYRVGMQSDGTTDARTGQANRLITTNNSSMLGEDAIPGNGGGQSSGRLGGLVELDPGKYVCSYARRAGTYSNPPAGKQMTNPVSELGLMFFDEQLKKTKTVKLLDRNDVNVIKMAKYGRNLLIAYATKTSMNTYYPDYLDAKMADDDSVYMMLVDPNGTKLQEPSQLLSSVRVSANDDFEVLQDGAIAWTYVDKNNHLNVAVLPISSAPSQDVGHTTPTDTPAPPSAKDIKTAQLYANPPWILSPQETVEYKFEATAGNTYGVNVVSDHFKGSWTIKAESQSEAEKKAFEVVESDQAAQASYTITSPGTYNIKVQGATATALGVFVLNVLPNPLTLGSQGNHYQLPQDNSMAFTLNAKAGESYRILMHPWFDAVLKAGNQSYSISAYDNFYHYISSDVPPDVPPAQGGFYKLEVKSLRVPGERSMSLTVWRVIIAQKGDNSGKVGEDSKVIFSYKATANNGYVITDLKGSQTDLLVNDAYYQSRIVPADANLHSGAVFAGSESYIMIGRTGGLPGANYDFNLKEIVAPAAPGSTNSITINEQYMGHCIVQNGGTVTYDLTIKPYTPYPD